MRKPVLISVIIPCRNEHKFIGPCLDSLLGNDYPHDELEVLVVDGMSEDGTREIVGKYQDRYTFIKMVDNPNRTIPSGLNIGIKNAKGHVLIRIDAHGTVAREYISRCLRYLDEYDADIVGGIWKIVPRDNSIIGKSIVLALSHPFGVGDAYYRFSGSREPMWVDTVPFFCCKRELFNRIGLFNEDIARTEDMAFNSKVRKMGGRILLHPEIVSYYYARSDFKSFCEHNFRNGVWAIVPFLYSRVVPISWRHIVPGAFVIGLLGSAGAALVWQFGAWMLLGLAGGYAMGNLAATIQIAFVGRDVRYLLVMPLIFGGLHLGYGLGSLWGVLELVARAFSRMGSRQREI